MPIDTKRSLACSMQRDASGDWHIQCAWKPGRTGIFTSKEAMDLALLIIETLAPGAKIITTEAQGKLDWGNK